MSEEYLDLIDENGNLTGEKALRSVCHAKGLWHRTVHIYLFREKNREIELLAHQRSMEKDLDPGKWDPRFGGHIKSGESVENAVLNELNEEIGLNIEPRNLILGSYKKGKGITNREYSYIFYLRHNDRNRLSFNDGEVQQVNWIKLDEFEKSVLDNQKKWAIDIKEAHWIRNDLLSKIS